MIELDELEKFQSFEDESVERICRMAIRYYGTKAQAGQTMEECGELIVALHKHFFRSNGGASDSLAGEIADVEIMCLQIRMILEEQGFGGKVDEARTFKLERLRKRLNEEEGR